MTHCPYKGHGRVLAGERPRGPGWVDRTPLEESQRIAGLVSFYNEKVDIYVDGVIQERPKTKFA